MSRRVLSEGGPLVLLVLGVASAVAAGAVWLAAFVLPGGSGLDGRAMQAFAGIAGPPLTPSIEGIARLADPWPFAIAAAAIVALALLRGRWPMAVAVPAILLAANVTTQLLKPALADARVVDLQGVATAYPGSWPSGHATAAMSLALCLVLVAGPRLRPLAALAGAAYAIAVGYALVVLGYHLPSDVLGGYLVAASFALLGAAALASFASEGLVVLLVTQLDRAHARAAEIRRRGLIDHAAVELHDDAARGALDLHRQLESRPDVEPQLPARRVVAPAVLHAEPVVAGVLAKQADEAVAAGVEQAQQRHVALRAIGRDPQVAGDRDRPVRRGERLARIGRGAARRAAYEPPRTTWDCTAALAPADTGTELQAENEPDSKPSLKIVAALAAGTSASTATVHASTSSATDPVLGTASRFRAMIDLSVSRCLARPGATHLGDRSPD